MNQIIFITAHLDFWYINLYFTLLLSEYNISWMLLVGVSQPYIKIDYTLFISSNFVIHLPSRISISRLAGLFECSSSQVSMLGYTSDTGINVIRYTFYRKLRYHTTATWTASGMDKELISGGVVLDKAVTCIVTSLERNDRHAACNNNHQSNNS